MGLYEDKLLEVLKEALPRVARVAYPLPADPSPVGPANRLQVRLTEAARTLGVELRRIDIRRPPDFDAFFAAARRQGTDAALVPEHHVVSSSAGTHRGRRGQEPPTGDRLRHPVRAVGRIALVWPCVGRE